MKAISRPRRTDQIQRVLSRVPVCALLGPRQCGKTTLARMIADRDDTSATFFDLESASGRAALSEPELALRDLRGLVVIDEIQRLPALFETLRPLADREGEPARFLVLGSAAPELVRGVSETLAGRVGFVDLGGFDLDEAGPERWRDLWLRGGFPRSFLAKNLRSSNEWRRDFVRTFLERDVASHGIRIPPESLRRFWTMVAHYHGQLWNGADLARALGVSQHTVRRYLDVLTGTYVVRQLAPWHENLSKRQYKSPKVYVRDPGILHALLGIDSHVALLGHPKRGASWEGFALEQVASLAASGADLYFWATHAGAELDLLVLHGGKRFGVEFKCADAPRMTKSLHTAIADLGLEHAWIVYPGPRRYDVHPRVTVLPLADVAGELPFLDDGPRGTESATRVG